MKLIIEDHCLRCGICIDMASDLFEKDSEEDIILVKVDPVPEDLWEAAREAVESCAVGAIVIKE